MTLLSRSDAGRPGGRPFSFVVVLVGGGHAHLEALRQARRFHAAGAELMLVDPGDFAYSGGTGAVLSGAWTPERNAVDLDALARRRGATIRRAGACGLDPVRRRILLDDGGAPLAYDRVSFDVGSVVDGTGLPADAVPVKPLAGLLALRARLAAGEGRRVLVVGGGASGVEVAGGLLALSRRLPRPLAVTLLSRGPLLAKAPAAAGRIAARRLRALGCHLRDGSLVEARDGVARWSGGEPIPYDHCVAATGLAPHPLLARLGLELAPGDGLRLAPTLQAQGDEAVFGAGDCAGLGLPKSGVHAVREGPVLVDNLLASLERRPLRPYRPQRRWLSILDLGDGTGLAIRGALVWHGRAMLALKRRIDAQFLDRYRTV